MPTKVSAVPPPRPPRERIEVRAGRDAARRRAATRDQMNEVHPGDILAGRYRVEGVLGRSRGLLLEAAHTSFEQRVVVRLISPALADPKAIDRFQRETRILSRLESEHVARIIDVGTLPNGALYLVREHLDGDKLSDLAKRQTLPLAAAVDLFLQVCEAVGEAHSHGVVLRDLQAGHVFVQKRRNGEPVAKLTDFGTCKVMRREDTSELSCTKLLGLSSSASPELIRQQRDIDQRADVWSLGCLLYELLTGSPAFLGDGTALMLAIAQDHPLPPSSLRVDIDIPQDLDVVLLRSLAKNREQRYGTVYELARQLRPYASPRGQLLVEQIARLAGEEPTALSVQPGRAPTRDLDEPDSEDTMAMVIADSEPGRGSVPPAQYTSVPAPAPVPAMPPSYPPPAWGAPPVGEAYPHGPPTRTSAGVALPAAPWAASAAPAAGQGLRPVAPWEQAMPWEQDLLPSRARRLRVALAVAALPLTVLLLVVVALSASDDRLAAQAALPLPRVAPIAAETPAAPAAEIDAPAEPAEPDAPTPVAETPAPRRATVVASDAAPAPKKGNQFLSSLKGDAKPRAADKRAADKREARASSDARADAGVDKGTIVAMAVGASCTFAVDGAARGSSSSIKVSVDAGRHTVTCSPAGGGAARSRSVNVPPGKAAVAVFRF